jgi:hypothetical protein
VVSPLHYQGIFVPHSSAASTARPSARIHELWFSNNMNYGNQKSNTPESNYPPKPTKLTPLYSRKRSEITNIDESIFPKNKSKTDMSPRSNGGGGGVVKRETFREKLRRELSNPNIHINDPVQFNEVDKKNKKKKIKKKDLNSSAVNESVDESQTTTISQNTDNILEPEKVTRLNSFVKNSIDDIWNTSALQPSVDESVDLGKIDEEFVTNELNNQTNRTKILGARKVKTPVPVSSSINLDDSNSNKQINEANSSISIRFGSATRSRAGDFFKANKNDDNIKLVDEFNRENQPSSSSSSAN